MPGRRRDARSAPAYPRTARVNEVLREVIADAIERMADSDERLRLVTVTAVETVADLSRATVYLSSLPAPALEALHAQRGHLQAAIGRQVRMKRTPHLAFEADPGVAHGLRVEEIIRSLHTREDRSPHGDAPGPPGGAAPGLADAPSRPGHGGEPDPRGPGGGDA